MATENSAVLRQCRKAIIRMVRMRNEYERKRISLFPCALRLKPDKIRTQPQDYFSATFADAVVLQEAVKETETQVRQLRQQALIQIDKLQHAGLRYVLTQYYTQTHLEEGDGAQMETWYTLSDVADEMVLTLRHVKRLHRRAIFLLDMSP